MAQRSERCNFRVEPDRAARYRAAAAVLGIEEASDFYRRACDELASRVVSDKDAAALHRATRPLSTTTTARPLSKKEQASGRSKRS